MHSRVTSNVHLKDDTDFRMEIQDHETFRSLHLFSDSSSLATITFFFHMDAETLVATLERELNNIKQAMTETDAVSEEVE